MISKIDCQPAGQINYDLGFIIIDTSNLTRYRQIVTAINTSNFITANRCVSELLQNLRSKPKSKPLILDYWNLIKTSEAIQYQLGTKTFIEKDLIGFLKNSSASKLNDVQVAIYENRFLHYYLNAYDSDFWFLNPVYYMTNDLYELFDFNNISRENIIVHGLFSGNNSIMPDDLFRFSLEEKYIEEILNSIVTHTEVSLFLENLICKSLSENKMILFTNI